jgi:diguanylate cyclase (GGDEF)-like protein
MAIIRERVTACLSRHRLPVRSVTWLTLALLPLLFVSIATDRGVLPGAGFIYPFTLVVTNLLVMILLWRAALRHQGLARAGWISVTLLVTLILVAMALWVFVYPDGAMRDSIHLPEILYLLASACAWTGFVFLRRADSANRTHDLRTLLDVAVMALSGGIFAWYFLIRPHSTGFLRDGFELASIVDLSPISNVILFTLASQVLLQRNARQPSHLFAVGILLITAADVGLALVIKDVIPLNVYFSGAWTLGVVVLLLDASRGVLPLEQRPQDAPDVERPDPVPVLRLLPYVAAVPCILLPLLAPGVLAVDEAGQQLSLWLTIIVLLLLMTRQVITLFDNQRLARNLIRVNCELAHQASHDSLTGLLNRASFTTKLEAAVAEAQDSGNPLTVCFIDLDDFKQVNDAHGHLFGDELLRLGAARLKEALLPGYFASRFGGDEFVVALPGLDGAEAADAAAAFLAAFSEPHEVGGIALRLRASLGASSFPADGRDAAALLHRADLAMYGSKRARSARRIAGSGSGEHSPEPRKPPPATHTT